MVVVVSVSVVVVMMPENQAGYQTVIFSSTALNLPSIFDKIGFESTFSK